MIVYTEQGLCNGPVSVHPSVCPVDRQQQRRAAGLLLSAGTCSRYRSIVACAGAQQQMRVVSRREPGDEAQPTQTHQFNGPLSRTTRVSRRQKGKTNLDFTEARDSEWQWHQLGHRQVCTSLPTDNHAPTTQFFTGRMPFLPPNQQRQSTVKNRLVGDAQS